MAPQLSLFELDAPYSIDVQLRVDFVHDSYYLTVSAHNRKGRTTWSRNHRLVDSFDEAELGIVVSRVLWSWINASASHASHVLDACLKEANNL